MSKKTTRQKQLEAKKKYNKAKQKFNTAKNKYSNELDAENKRFHKEQEFMDQEKQKIRDRAMKDLENRLEDIRKKAAESMKNINAGDDEVIGKVKMLKRLEGALNGLANQGPLSPELMGFKKKLDAGYSGILFEATELKKNYLQRLQNFQILIEDYPLYSRIINDISGMTALKFFFLYGEFAPQFLISNLGETFGSDAKIIRDYENGEADEEEYADADERLTFNIDSLYSQLQNSLSEEQTKDVDELERMLSV